MAVQFPQVRYYISFKYMKNISVRLVDQKEAKRLEQNKEVRIIEKYEPAE